jgi:opacity protein-like surface antigen
MQRHLPKIAAAALCLAAAPAFAADGNFFVSGNIGQSDYHAPNSSYLSHYGSIKSDTHDTAGALRFGYRWNNVVNYGVEAGYVDLGELTTTSNWNYGGSDRVRTKVRGWLLGGNVSYNFTPDWYISARAGLFRAHADVNAKASFMGSSMEWHTYNATKTGEYAGLGVGYNITQALSVGLNYDYHHARFQNTNGNIGMYSVSAEYRF